MELALRLAWRGEGRVEPNPMVGAVVVSDGILVGQGWHEVFGGPHAEVMALEEAGEKARGATLWVTLEPCSHQGKTPPCTQGILESGIARVVVGTVDPNPKVSGSGVQWLREAGLEVQVGCLEEEAQELIRWFRRWVRDGVPYGYGKWAMTLDGKIATRTGDSKWISGPQSRNLVHQLRSEVGAILVGMGTVSQDDPLLTARVEGGENPLRVVVDSALRISPECRLVQTANEVPLVVATTQAGSSEKRKQLEALGVEIHEFGTIEGRIDLGSLAQWLAKGKQITRILYEGGGEVLSSAFAAQLIDEVWVFLAPKIIGGRDAPGAVGGHGLEWMAQALKIGTVRVTAVGEDQLIVGRLDGSLSEQLNPTESR